MSSVLLHLCRVLSQGANALTALLNKLCKARLPSVFSAEDVSVPLPTKSESAPPVKVKKRKPAIRDDDDSGEHASECCLRAYSSGATFLRAKLSNLFLYGTLICNGYFCG